MEAGVAYQALSGMAMLSRARPVAAKWITEGIAYLEARQIEAPLRYLQGLHALYLFDGGEWDAAEAAADRLLGQPEACGITQVFALLTRARLQTRRGLLDEASATLQTLWTVAETCGLLQHIGPAAAALGEHAALYGGAGTAIGPLRSARQLAVAVGAMPLVAELGFWLDRLGEASVPLSSDPAEPYGLLQAGDWRAAAGIWEDLGFPYERARTLAEADDVDALCTALAIADRLGAAALAARVRARLRMLGVAAPRGPRAATRANPAGLTERQAEVLELLAEGMTDGEIAERLVLSVRTVNRHVSSILDKLGVRSRRDAARRLAAMR
jgi:DNA-binding CsgD family transcriptional regulator